jgi:acetate kinase
MTQLLVLNAGSSSLKFAIFTADKTPQLLMKGHVAQRGHDMQWLVKDGQGQLLEKSQQTCPQDHFEHDAALALLLDWLDRQPNTSSFTVIGHRVVHGGQQYSAPVRVNAVVLETLQELIPLAPLHQPHNLKVIRLLQERWPNVPQVACFDTAFHATQTPVAQAFALPHHITQAGVRRYGFHGLSYEFIATQLSRVMGDKATGKVIVAHLGNGASLCGMVNGKSMATTMGFSALDGLVMGTRCGAIDPGVVLYLLQAMHMDAQAVSDLLYNDSGLLGVSGVSSDMQVLLNSEAPSAAQAIDLFVYRIVCEIGALAAAMGGVDALVFTAGIGEHAAIIRERICHACAWLGAKLDATANKQAQEQLSTPDSALFLAMIPTDEEKMIALHALALASD